MGGQRRKIDFESGSGLFSREECVSHLEFQLSQTAPHTLAPQSTFSCRAVFCVSSSPSSTLERGRLVKGKVPKSGAWS